MGVDERRSPKAATSSTLPNSSTYKHFMTLELEFENSKEFEIVYKVFKVLENEIKFHKGFIQVLSKSNNKLIIQAYAIDLSGLRSLINSVLKMLYIVLGSLRYL